MRKRGRPPYPDVLTPREWEVLALLRQGLTNDQVADRLNITVHAARYHVSEILSKLGVSSRQEAAAWEPEKTKPFWTSALAFALWPLRHIPFAVAAKASAAAVVVGAAGAIGFLVWGLVVTGGEANLDLVAQPGKIAHIRASIKMIEPDGSRGAAGYEETWVDSTGAFVRTEQRDSDGEVVRIAVRRYNSTKSMDLSEEGDSHFRMQSYPNAVSGWVPTEFGGPLYFRYFFRGDLAETIGQTGVDERAATVVRVPLESGENPLPVEGVVDQKTGWPFEIRLFKRNGAGGFDSAGKWLIRYELVESLPIGSAIHLFEDETYDRSAASFKEMSLADGEAFQGFPLLYLGDSFDGMGLGTVTESAPELDRTIRQVLFTYVEWAGTPPIRLVRQLKVMITPAQTEAGARFHPQPGQEVITTAKGEALFEPDNNRLDLLTEGVLVVIQGDNTSSSAQILSAAQTLTALNPGAVRTSSPTP